MNEVVAGNKKYMEGIRVMLASQEKHKGKIKYIPALQGYQLICENCGEVLWVNVEGTEVEIEGECNPPETLGISVKENVGIKDVFGGA